MALSFHICAAAQAREAEHVVHDVDQCHPDGATRHADGAHGVAAKLFDLPETCSTRQRFFEMTWLICFCRPVSGGLFLVMRLTMCGRFFAAFNAASRLALTYAESAYMSRVCSGMMSSNTLMSWSLAGVTR